MKLCSDASCLIARPEQPAHPYPRDPTLVTTKLALAAAGDGTNSANRNVWMVERTLGEFVKSLEWKYATSLMHGRLKILALLYLCKMRRAHAVFRHTPLGCHSPTLSGSPPPQSRVERRSSQASHYQPLEKAQTQQQVSYGSFPPPKRTSPARCRTSNVHSWSQYQNRINFSKFSLLHMVLQSEFAKKVGHAWGHN